MNHSLGIAIESLVAVLLLLTIGYCMLLNARLKRLKADEHSLKAIIAELITATEIAERAIGGLKHTVRDVNENLGDQLNAAAHMVGSAEAAARRRRSCGAAALQDRDCRAASIGAGAGAGDGQGVGRKGGRRRSGSLFRAQKVQRPCRMKSFRDIRVLPVVLVAIFGLHGAQDRRPRDRRRLCLRLSPASTGPSWAQENLNFPGSIKEEDVTGSVDKPKEEKKDEAPKPAVAAPETKPDAVVFHPEDNQPVSASERAILERLQARRQELEARAREIDIRESLLKAAEKRIELHVEEMKAVESRVSTTSNKRPKPTTRASRASSPCTKP